MYNSTWFNTFSRFILLFVMICAKNIMHATRHIFIVCYYHLCSSSMKSVSDKRYATHTKQKHIHKYYSGKYQTCFMYGLFMPSLKYYRSNLYYSSVKLSMHGSMHTAGEKLLTHFKVCIDTVLVYNHMEYCRRGKLIFDRRRIYY